MRGFAADDLPVEVVERKGKGHPDSICDALAEEVSRALIREYVAHLRPAPPQRGQGTPVGRRDAAGIRRG